MSLNIGTPPSVHPEKSRNIWLGEDGGGGEGGGGVIRENRVNIG